MAVRTSIAARFLLSVRHSTITGTWCGAKPSKVRDSYCTCSSSRPAPFLIARSSVSRGIEARLACSTALRSRGLESGSAPVRAATMISLASLVKMRPFVAAASARPLAFH